MYQKCGLPPKPKSAATLLRRRTASLGILGIPQGRAPAGRLSWGPDGENKTGGPKAARSVFSGKTSYFIITAATFLNALMSASMCSSVYVGWVQKEIVESASECATAQLNFV